MRTAFGVLVALALALTGGSLQAQDMAAEADTLPADSMRWSINPYVGVLLLSDELDDVNMEVDSPVIFGARIGYRIKPTWLLEGAYGYGSLSGESEGFGAIDGSLHLYYASIGYRSHPEGNVHFIVSGGFGGMRYSYDEFERRGVLLQDISWANELVVVPAVALEVDTGERFAIRVDAADVIQFCSEEDEPIDETEDFSHCPLGSSTLSNPAFTGGVVIRF